MIGTYKDWFGSVECGILFLGEIGGSIVKVTTPNIRSPRLYRNTKEKALDADDDPHQVLFKFYRKISHAQKTEADRCH